MEALLVQMQSHSNLLEKIRTNKTNADNDKPLKQAYIKLFKDNFGSCL